MLQRQFVLADAMMLPGDACRVHAVQYRCVPIQNGSDAVETQAPKEIEGGYVETHHYILSFRLATSKYVFVLLP
eukprot:COSAG01_NODE_4792_length_4740_cov_8.902392_3_plen_74_part_00